VDEHSFEMEYGPEERYRLYVRRGQDLRLLATMPDPQSAGVALATLHSEGEWGDHDRVGLLDGVQHVWLVNPFCTGQAPVHFSGRGEPR